MPSVIRDVKVNATYLHFTGEEKKYHVEYYVAPGKHKQAIEDKLKAHNLESATNLRQRPGVCAFCEPNLETFSIHPSNSNLDKTIVLFDKKIYRRTFNALPIGKQGTPCNIDWESLEVAGESGHSSQECPTCGCKLPSINFENDKTRAKGKELSELGLEHLLNPMTNCECIECGEILSWRKYEPPRPVTLNSCEDCLKIENCKQLSDRHESVIQYFKTHGINCDIAFVEVSDGKHPELLYDPATVIGPVIEITSAEEVKAPKKTIPLSVPLQRLYEMYNARDIIRCELCEKYKQYDLKPVGSGDGSIWVDLPQNGRLFLASDAALSYVLLYSKKLENSSDMHKGEALPEHVSRWKDDALPGFLKAHYPKKTTAELSTVNKIALLLTKTSIAEYKGRIPEGKLDEVVAQGVKDASVLLDWYFNLLAKII